MTLPRLMGVRLGGRLARRELMRSPWRSFLVFLMVFLPTLVTTGVVIVLRTAERSASERQVAEYGQADAVATFGGGVSTPEQLDQLRAGLPDGSRVVAERAVTDRVRGDDWSTHFTITDGPLDDQISEGRFDHLRGRVPKRAGEVVVNDAAARLLRVDIGDSIRPQRLDRPLEVVGKVRTLSADVNEAVGYVGSLADVMHASPTVLVDLPARALDPRTGAPREVSPVPGWTLVETSSSAVNRTAGVFLTYAGGGVALVVFATIITAAFAIGARRQLHTIGLLASSGASPATIKWFLVSQGALIGALGAAAGILVGVIGARSLPPWFLADFVDHPIGAPVARPADLLPILLIGTAVATAAAWLPARRLSKTRTLQALAGRRPEGTVRRRTPACGAASIGLGLALLAIAAAGDGYGPSLQALAAMAGVLAVLLGAIAIAPWIVAAIERVSSAWPGSWRLAGRSLGRSRVRSSAVIGAVVAVSAAVVAGITLYGSLKPDTGGPDRIEVPKQRQNQIILEMLDSRNGASPPVSGVILDRVRAVVPDAEPVRATQLVPAGVADAGQESEALFASYVSRGDERDRGRMQVGVATRQLLDVLEVPGDLRAALERGEAIGIVRPPFETGRVRLLLPDADGRALLPLAGSFDSPAASVWLPTIVVSAARAESLGLVGRPAPWTVLQLPEALTDGQHDALDLLRDDIQWEQRTQPVRQSHLSMLLPSDDTYVSWDVVKVGLLGLSLLFVLAVVAVGLGLAARDSEDERRVLSALGAPPRALHRVGALRAVLLVLAAVVIAVPAALLSSAVIVAADDNEHALRIDLWAVLFVAVVVPLVVGVVGWTGGWVRDALRPTRPDVFAFSE